MPLTPFRSLEKLAPRVHRGRPHSPGHTPAFWRSLGTWGFSPADSESWQWLLCMYFTVRDLPSEYPACHAVHGKPEGANLAHGTPLQQISLLNQAAPDVSSRGVDPPVHVDTTGCMLIQWSCLGPSLHDPTTRVWRGTHHSQTPQSRSTSTYGSMPGVRPARRIATRWFIS